MTCLVIPYVVAAGSVEVLPLTCALAVTLPVFAVTSAQNYFGHITKKTVREVKKLKNPMIPSNSAPKIKKGVITPLN
jgi:hypothetical protein